MKIENKMGAIGDENTISGVEPFLLDVLELVEEGWNMNNDTRADEIETIRIHKT